MPLGPQDLKTAYDLLTLEQRLEADALVAEIDAYLRTVALNSEGSVGMQVAKDHSSAVWQEVNARYRVAGWDRVSVRVYPKYGSGSDSTPERQLKTFVTLHTLDPRDWK